MIITLIIVNDCVSLFGWYEKYIIIVDTVIANWLRLVMTEIKKKSIIV